MRAVVARLRRDPGLALVLLAILAAAVLYAPTLGRGLVAIDDDWLYTDNFVLKEASASSLHTIFFEIEMSPTRFALGAEYLPIRDLSVMLDFAIWGDSYGWFHLTNLVLYLIGIALVFAMLDAFGVDRTTAGLAVLIWALHPSHAESVAWLAERKGLLAVVFASLTGLCYARFRAGGRARWLIGGTLAAVCAVWSKAPAAFTIAAFAGLEVVLPARRISWRRSLAGLGVIGGVAALAFIPVLLVAFSATVVGAVEPADGRLLTTIGVHGFYLRLAAMAMPNALSYPIDHAGSSPVDLILGGVGLIAVLAALAPRLGRFRVPAELRAASVLWIVPFIPISHLVLPLQNPVADRYALVLSLGATLAIATGVMRIAKPNLRIALCAVICLTASVRTWDAQSSWGSELALWKRCTESNPLDGGCWSLYGNAVEAQSGDPSVALAVVERALQHGRWPEVLLRRALLLGKLGDAAGNLAAMREAAEGGHTHAMANLAGMLLEGGDTGEALTWARRASAKAPYYMFGRRANGIVALSAKQFDEAARELGYAFALEPKCSNRFFLGVALLELRRTTEAIGHLEACVDDPRLGARARAALAGARR